MYKLKMFSWDEVPSSVIRTDSDGVQYCIPFNPDNADYQQYLKWLEAGNTPEPAEEQQ
jgi:hypothetical protein